MVPSGVKSMPFRPLRVGITQSIMSTPRFGGFADGESADGVSVSAEVGDESSAFAAEFGVGATLHDGEEALVVAVFGFGGLVAVPSAFEPAFCEVEAFAGVCEVACAGGAFVKGHHYVGADGALYVDHFFWREEVAGAVDVTAEVGAFFGEFAV